MTPLSEEEQSDEEFWAPVRERNVGDLCRAGGCCGTLDASGHMLVCNACSLLVEPGRIVYYDEVVDMGRDEWKLAEQRLRDYFGIDLS